jgi:hypothetical protein
MVDENLAHRACGDAEKMIFIENAGLDPQQFQKQLTDQSRRLQGVAGAFASKQGGRDSAQPLECQAVNRIAREIVA